jgi:hypothetical protein
MLTVVFAHSRPREGMREVGRRLSGTLSQDEMGAAPREGRKQFPA